MCGCVYVWVCLCVGFVMCGFCNVLSVLVICVPVLTVFLYCFVYVYLFFLCSCYFCKLYIFIVIFMYSYCYVCSVLYILFSSCQLALFGYPD